MSRWTCALFFLALPLVSVCVGCEASLSPVAPVMPPAAATGPLGTAMAQPAPLPPAASVDPAAAPAEEELAALDDEDEDGAAASALVAPGPSPTRYAPPSTTPPATSPALALSDAEIDHRFHHDPSSLGPASVGPASAGALVNGVQMPAGAHWSVRDPGRAYGTQETVDALVRCIERVNERHPGAPPLSIGHLSAKNGGHLSPHKSHQSGRDADIGYYYKGVARDFVRATEDNLDLPRTWTLIKTALQETTVEMILVDGRVQRLLADYAVQSGEDAAFVDEVFQIRGKNARAPIRHIRGHDNHIHFRFFNPEAQEMGKRVARFVVVPRAPVAVAGAPRVAASQAETAGYAQIRARSGDTLVILARRYGTTVEEIQRANGLAGNSIRAGMVYRIPQKAPPAPVVVTRGPKAPPRVAQHKPQAKPAPRPSMPGAKSGASAPDR